MAIDKVKVEVARKSGIVYPEFAWLAHEKTKVPFWTICAFLVQETNGGQNIYGHDVGSNGVPRPFWGVGAVNRDNYLAYKHERDLGITEHRFASLGRRMQGVGPMQLTWYQYQDGADALGGCWNPEFNILQGAIILKGHYDVAKTMFKSEVSRWHYVALKYNGKESYAQQMDARFQFWRKLIVGSGL